MRRMLEPDQAWQRIEPHLAPLKAERVLRRRAVGRTLAAQTLATLDVPGHDVSAMDGYAVSSEAAADRPLPVTGRVVAGDPPGARLAPGTALRIMTGAPVPLGADRVIPVELSDGGRESVRFSDVLAAGAHIRQRAEITAAGTPLLAAGSLLTPGALGLLATHGIERVSVIRRPRVKILTTGDEVVAPEETPEPGQLRDSHTDFLLAASASIGADAHSLGIARDQESELVSRIEEGLDSDVLLLTGGVSKGELDLVEGGLAGLGVTPLFDAVAIQPGKPVVAGHHGGGLVFGLPGNPASAMVTFWLFVRPALRRLTGLADHYWQGALKGRLAAPHHGAKGRHLFLPCEVAFDGTTPQVTPVLPEGSHDVAAYAHGTGLLRIPAGSKAASAGEECEFLPLCHWPVPQVPAAE